MAATVLITGATGLVGFRILLAALAAGHNVRYTARSATKADAVAANPAVRRLSPGPGRLSPVVVPDPAAAGALDAAARGVTHIIHAGSPVPLPTLDPADGIFRPTVAVSSGLLASALRSPSVRRVVITSSVAAQISGPGKISPATRLPLPSPVPEIFDGVIPAYVLGKIAELHNTEAFVVTQKPHFTVSHVFPGYVFGRNDLAVDAEMMQNRNSSNNFLVTAILGGEVPMAIHDGFVHVDDVADLHLRAAFEDEAAGKDFGLAIKVDYSCFFDYVEKAFPKAVEAGIFRRGIVPMAHMDYDSSDAEALLGGKLRSFESAVVDVAGQYLEILGQEKA